MSSESQDRPEDDKQPEPPKGQGKEAKKDPFDLSKLRVNSDYSESVKAKRHHLRISARRPHRTEWVHVDPNPERTEELFLYEHKHNAGGANEVYLVTPEVVSCMPDDTFQADVYVSVNRQMDPFLWICRKPDEERPSAWHQTLQEAAEKAHYEWIKVRASMGVGGYEYFSLGENVKPPVPVFPEESLQDLLRLAFKDYLIDSPDHIVVQKLEGRK